MSRPDDRVFWNCDVQGCYKRRKLIPLGKFTDNLPGRLGFSDIDGTTEKNCHFLHLEPSDVRKDDYSGQMEMLEKLTLDPRHTLVQMLTTGDHADCTILEYRICNNGTWSQWRVGGLYEVNLFIGKWSAWAQRDKQFKGDAGPWPDWLIAITD